MKTKTFSKKNFFLISLLLIFIFSVNTSNFNSIASTKLKLQENSELNGKIAVIIVNQDNLYSENQISEIENEINVNLVNDYPELSFNVSVVNDKNTILFEYVAEVLESESPSYVVIIGAIGFSQRGFYSDVLLNWTQNKGFEYVKNFALIDYLFDIDENEFKEIDKEDTIVNKNVTFQSFDYSQAGFMSGIKSASLTTTNKIGILLDHSFVIDFNNKIASNQGYKNSIFVKGFISGVEYASEHLLNSTEIQVKSEIFNNEIESQNAVDIALNKFSDFGADIIFNMESGYDELVIQSAKTKNMKIGNLGNNNSDTAFSLVKNIDISLSDLLLNWNVSNLMDYSKKFTLVDSEIMGLSIYDSTTIKIQNELLDGKIELPEFIIEEVIPGFELFAIIFSLITLKKIYKKSSYKKL